MRLHLPLNILSQKFIFLLKLIVGITIAFLFLHRCITFIDPDMGWHVRTGEWIVLHQQIPHQDIYSYTLAGHEWIAHEWLLEIIFYKAALSGTWWLLILLFFGFAFVPVVIWLLRAKTILSLMLITLAGVIMHDIVGVRPQILSFFLFFLCYELILKHANAPHRIKILWGAPFFFFLWANLHGSFPAGLILWGCLIAGTYITNIAERKTLPKYMFFAEIISFSASLLATLCTPYGIALWRETIVASSSPILQYVSEWQPALAVWQISLPVIVVISCGAIAMVRKKFTLAEHAALIFFLICAVRQARIVMQFFVIALDMGVNACDQFMKKARALKDEEGMRIIGMLEWFLFGVIVAALALALASREIVAPYAPPFRAAQALHIVCAHFSCGNTFNDFNMGGAQIFENPERKVFTAGYSPHWTDEQGWSPTEEIIDLTTKHPEHSEELFERYGIMSVFLTQPTARTISNVPHWMSGVHLLFNQGEEPEKNLVTILEEAHWCTMYHDDRAVILLAPSRCRKPNDKSL